jgi:hypothetical protein
MMTSRDVMKMRTTCLKMTVTAMVNKELNYKGDDAPEEENEVSMDTIRDNIANGLIS